MIEKPSLSPPEATTYLRDKIRFEIPEIHKFLGALMVLEGIRQGAEGNTLRAVALGTAGVVLLAR